jgi:predicted porin
MQKKLIALAVAGAAAGFMSAPVFAQSQVTIYGTFDAGVRHQSNVDGNGAANTTMDSSGTYNSNRFGFKGSEDLGNGMKANFDIEGGFLSGSGTGSISGGLFGRKQIVGLSGGWGAVDLGRNYTSIFYTTAGYDPFHYKYTGIIPIAGLDGARRDNTITYTGHFGGVTLRANHALGEVAGDAGALSNNEIGASFGAGPFSMGAAYGTDRVASSPDRDSKQWTIGGAYKMNPFEVMIGYDKDTTEQAGGDLDRKVSWIGGKYMLSGANAVSAAYYHDKRDDAAASTQGTKKLFIVSFVHNLSKRTELYFDVDQAKVDGSLKTGTDDTNTGISVGINHAF